MAAPPAEGERASCEAALGDQLKIYFDTVVAGPVPDRLLTLAEALDQALDRGQFKCGRGRKVAGAR